MIASMITKLWAAEYLDIAGGFICERHHLSFFSEKSITIMCSGMLSPRLFINEYPKSPIFLGGRILHSMRIDAECMSDPNSMG